MQSKIKAKSVISCNYKPGRQKVICQAFHVDEKQFVVVSHKQNCYHGLLSERASFRPNSF